MNKFREWVTEKGGTEAVGKLMGKKQKAVQHWIRGHSNPKLKDAQKILKLARGKLTLEDIIKAGK